MANKKTIMLVDDDSTLLGLAVEMLGFFDIFVHGAETLEEACEIYSQNREAIALVITDMNLENASGIDVFEALRDIDDDFISVLASGMITDMDIKSYKEKGFDEVIKKPYSFQSLQEMINRYLA
ncbi:MAG: response regulator [Candidatus Cloacimonetes bacterium]|nr:response regulator [Candidatus Cloacimonadota bacterium]